MVKNLRENPEQVRFVYDGDRERAKLRREETAREAQEAPLFEDITSLEEALSQLIDEEPLPEDLQALELSPHKVFSGKAQPTTSTREVAVEAVPSLLKFHVLLQ
jgi:hypothetical protein